MTDHGGLIGPAGGHVDIDVLADRDAGVLDPTAAAQVDAHVAACESCRQTLTSVGGVTAALAALPEPPMPADVAERLATALDGERAVEHAAGVTPGTAAATVTPLVDRRRRLRNAAPGWAAVGSVAAVAVACTASLVTGHGTSSSNKGSAAAGGVKSVAPPAIRFSSSDADYTTDTVRTALPGITGVSTPAAASGGRGTYAAEQPEPSPSATADSLEALPPSLHTTFPELTTGEGMAVCLHRLPLAAPPIAVQFSKFMHGPRAIIVVPATPGRVSIFAVTDACGDPGTSNFDLTYIAANAPG